MTELGEYLSKKEAKWEEKVREANLQNPWFTPEFIYTASENIIEKFLEPGLIRQWAAHYHIDENITKKKVGIVMAGNIPLVGFHDFLSTFICGHRQKIKLSSKDSVLLKHLVDVLHHIEPASKEFFTVEELLTDCDAYIATGSQNTARYFEQYFGKYPNIIRKNKTSVAFLTGHESQSELESLSDDIHLYFGLGCRNVTKLFVPESYNFEPLLASFRKYSYFSDIHKYKNNYDYQLSLMLMNGVYYMTDGSTLLVKNKSNFSPISVLNYEYYENALPSLENESEIQCLIGQQFISFGAAQKPGLFDYADGVDTMEFLVSIG